MKAMGVRIAGRGEADEARMDLFTQAARSAVRYADPASWTAATAISLALECDPQRFEKFRERTGLITISSDGPAQTIAALAEASKEGFSSPLRYPAANPALLGGVACIALGIRGPTMNLATPPAIALPAALRLAGRWLGAHHTPMVAVAVSRRVDPGLYPVRCLLLASPQLNGQAKEPLGEAHTAWLLAV